MKLKKLFDLSEIPGQIYFMSDLHYNHENIMYMGDGRDFDTLEIMNAYILNTLRGTLTPDDIVFDLGDLGWKSSPDELKTIIGACGGAKIYKVMGNHDNENLYNDKGIKSMFSLVTDFLEIGIRDKDGSVYQLSLFHNPIDDFNNMYRGGLHLFGHVHGNKDAETDRENLLRVDVGFDGALAKSVGSFLVPFSSVLAHFKKKTGGVPFNVWAKNVYKK